MYDILQLLVGDVVEKLGDVAFQNIAVIAISAVELFHLFTQPVQTEQSAFAFLPGAVIPDKDLLQPGHYYIVAETMLYDLILERGRLDHSLLRLIDLELGILRHSVGLVFELPNEGMNAVQRRSIEPGRALFVPFPAFGSAECPVHIAKVDYFLEVGHTA